MTFRPNRNLEREIRRSPQVRALLRHKGQQVAREAERIGGQVSDSYRAEVEDTADGVRVVANTRALNAAGWIEFGSTKNPPHAPLRKGAEVAGLDLRARQGGTT